MGTLIATILQNLSLIGVSMTPEMVKLIDANIPIIEQREMRRRLRICFHQCKRFKFGAEQIAALVKIYFKDQTDTMIQNITSVLDAELLKPKA